jgi:amidase
MIETAASWQEAAAAKRQERQASVPKEWLLPASVLKGVHLGPDSGTDVLALDIPGRSGLLSELDLAITEKYSCRDLLQKLAAQELTSAQVTLAFCKRAAIAQQLV